mmetsp:Transcript_5532/g.6921  ORF Transcript_5532/g.6921 Transcript_5532/m.6921 type:complete len:489 (+) Transcript_5532:91-1557(+)
MKTKKLSSSTGAGLSTSVGGEGGGSVSDSLAVQNSSGATEFDLDREAGKLFAEIIKRRSKDPGAGLPAQSSQALYKPHRTSVFHDPEYNPRLKNVHNESSVDLAKDNEKNWGSSGATWSRMPRFPKRHGAGPKGLQGSVGDGLGRERFLAQERFYNTDYGNKKTLYSSVRTSQWGISQASKSKKFEEYQRQHKVQTSPDLGPGTYLANEPWQPKEVCGEVPQSSIFSSTSKRELFNTPGFRVINDDVEYKRRTRKENKSRSQLRSSPILHEHSQYSYGSTLSSPTGGSQHEQGGRLNHHASAPATLRPHTTVDHKGGFFEDTILEEEERGLRRPVPPGTWHGRPSHLHRHPVSGESSPISRTSARHHHSHSMSSLSSNKSARTPAKSLARGNTFSKASRTTFADVPNLQQQAYTKSYVRVPSTRSVAPPQNERNIDLSRSAASVYPERSSQSNLHQESLGSLRVEEQDSVLMLRATTAPVHSVYEQVL